MHAHVFCLRLLLMLSFPRVPKSYFSHFLQLSQPHALRSLLTSPCTGTDLRTFACSPLSHPHIRYRSPSTSTAAAFVNALCRFPSPYTHTTTPSSQCSSA
ncbi:hypothetical protein F5888DRAFT_1750294 [Russula emetica]|nr:hypothetical protein F5888DRAFT_1750294 [Russula emetica]